MPDDRLESLLCRLLPGRVRSDLFGPARFDLQAYRLEAARAPTCSTRRT
jgi:hypothetical protein